MNTIELYKKMLTIREFEESIANKLLNNPWEIKTPCHLYIWQEAVAVWICSNLTKNDKIFWTHRNHWYYIAKGWNVNKLMAEIYWKESWCSKWRWWSMHVSDIENGMIWSSAIVAWTVSLALWAWLSNYIDDNNDIVVAFFGDWAINEWVIFESINFAVLRKIPIIFVCENNLYATHVPLKDHLSNSKISELVKWFKIKSITIDGNDVLKVSKESKNIIKYIRSWNWPVFIECLTYRHRWHVWPYYDIDKWLREKEELDFWLKKCPIKKLEKHIIKNKILSKQEMIKVKKNIIKNIEKCITFAQKSKYPETKTLTNLVFKK